ncbi:MAG: 16S rRNA (cytosine(1402)-N(4))-methyltransferase RsmH [Gammaproteobacteria bacterium]|nr:16S rRNA (cytosine(1402)-N(4))-methyltransferase RsmH [Gammaproteobacteria bacterium]
MEFSHQPVLLDEVLAKLNIVMDGKYVDATFGRGGHASEMLARLGKEGSLLVLDRDPDAIDYARERFAGDPRVRIRQAPFSELETCVSELGWQAQVGGVLMDLGVSSPQLDDPARGFSFQSDGPLDMRMDPGAGMPASEWLGRASEKEISEVLRDYGEEKFHRRIARAIVAIRNDAGSALETTRQLADLIDKASPSRERHKHPATRSFQAIRMHVNRELEELDSCLGQAVKILAPGGRLCVISFHSLEDRIVKRFMRRHARPDPMYAGMPDIPPEARPILKLVGKAVRAGREELAANPRARSAIMRIAERLP